MDQTTQFQQPSTPVSYSRSWHITDIVFHSLVIVFDIVVLGISIALALNVTLGVYLLLWTIPQVGVSLLWSIAELITKCARRDHQGIHPGAHVALHLLLWLGFCASAVLNGFLLASLIIYADHADDNYYYGYYDYDYYGLGSDYLTLVQALVAFVALLMYVSSYTTALVIHRNVLT